MKWLINYLKQCFLFLLFAVFVIVVIFLYAKIAQAPKHIIESAQAADNQNVEVVERDDIDRLIDQLAWCESRNNPNALNPNDPDTRSVGLLQFKDATFWHYNEIYKILPDLERHEVENVIWDGEVQRKLAKEIIKDGGWRNWFNCNKKFFL